MNLLPSKTRIALAVLAMTASAGVSATALSNVIIGGGAPCNTWLPTDPANPNKLISQNSCAQANVNDALQGSGNVELGKFGSDPFATLSGDFNGKPFSLRSLTQADWTTGQDAAGKWVPTALTVEYIQGAAAEIKTKRPLFVLTPQGLDQAVQNFLTVNPVINQAPWQRVSDPNIDYVDMDAGHVVHIGLAGFDNATPFLQTVFGGQLPPGFTLPDGLQVSEVVFADLAGLTDYLFGFDATSSGVYAGGNPQNPAQQAKLSYSGTYDVQIPEPESLALLGIGLVGLFLGRRRRV